LPLLLELMFLDRYKLLSCERLLLLLLQTRRAGRTFCECICDACNAQLAHH